MLARERLAKIKMMVQQDGKVYVNELCEMFNLSEDSIRKDLKILENQGIIDRIYGGALRKEDVNIVHGHIHTIKFDQRLTQDISLKQIIAEKAMSIIEEDEVIYMDASSTNVLIAEMIARSGKRVTVVSNCLNIISALLHAPHIRLICIGGNYCAEIAGFYGGPALRELDNYYFDKAFIGVVAVDLSNGSLMVDNFDDTDIKSKLIDISKMSILPCLSKKFGKRTSYKYGELSQIDMVITEGISQNLADQLELFEVMIL